MSQGQKTKDVFYETLQLVGLPACVCDAGGTVLAHNSQLTGLLGERPTLAGDSLLAFVSPGCRTDSAGHLRSGCQQQKPRKWDSILLRDDGREIAVEVCARGLPDASAAMLVFADVTGYRREVISLRRMLSERQALLENAVAGIDDIHTQRKNEEKLIGTLLEMQAIMDNAPLAIGFHRENRILRYNRRYAETFGFTGDGGVGLSSQCLYPSQDVFDAVASQALPLLLAGRPFQTEMTMRRQDDSTFWADSVAYVINPERPLQGTVWIFDDRSAQKATVELMDKLLLEQKAILDNASVGILFSRARMILRCNPRMAEMFGYQSEDLIGRAAVDLYPSPTAYEEFGAEAAPLLSRGLQFDKSEFQFRRKDGGLFWGRVRARAVDPEHNQEGTIWIIEDVTESRQLQMEVEAIMTNASVCILFTKNRIMTRYNRRFAEMFGFDGDEGLGLPGVSIYPSQEAYLRLGAQATPLLSAGQPFQTEMELRRRDNSTFWAQLIAYVLNPEDPSQGTIWIIEDRTEHKRAEETLRNALMENEAILESAVIGIAVVEDGFNLRSNRKMEELLDYQPGQIAGISVQDFYPDTAAWNAARSEAARDFDAGRVHMCERMLVRRDGSAFWARLSGRPFDLTRPHGRSVWLVDDVTQRREAAEAVSRARDELEVRVQERTAELAGANLKLQAEIAERRQVEARVHYMAYHDSLTGLPNRSMLADRLTRSMQAVQRCSRRLAVLFIDLDRFKIINDTLGHMTGDHLLKEVAGRLIRAVRGCDTVSRLGGDEFVVVVPDLSLVSEAAGVAQNIIDALSAPFPIEGRDLHITPSIGICIFPDDAQDVDALMRHADTAMYHAKACGRNNYQFFTRQMHLAAAQHFEMESNLRGALARGEFVLYYQPIIDVASRKMHAMEVLLRWQSPAMGMVMPDNFIPIIEENGLIVPIGEWVIRQACAQNMAWQRQGLPVVPLAVNLSPRQFLQRGLVDSIRTILEETGIDPALLELEITETALMLHGEQTMDILRQIHGMGICLSIDDFGTGYSSLAYLKRFPVDKIKIDRAFIHDLEHNADDRSIVAAIIALSDNLQLSVVAEGVETEAQFSHLASKACRYAQGYLFSMPVPAAAASDFLVEQASGEAKIRSGRMSL